MNICYTIDLYYKDATAYIRRREEKSTVTYRVTQQDIDAGLPDSTQHCPVAHAIRRRRPCTPVHVQLFTVQLGDKFYRLPQRVSKWICKYDAGQEVWPISFEL